MENRKILFILAIAIVAVGVLGFVSAAEGTTENIRGIDFNIPSDFVKSNYSDQNNESNIATTDICIYSDSRGDVYSIMVMEYKSSPDGLLNEKDDGNKTTIKNIDGYLTKESNGDLVFKYIKGKCLVEVSAPTKDKIEEMIIA